MIAKGLTYGNVDARFAERILNSAYNLTRQAVLHYTRRSTDIDRALFEMHAPPGSEQVADAIGSILSGYPASLDLPQVCDLFITEVFVKNNPSKGWLRRIFAKGDLVSRIEVLRTYLRALNRAGACPGYLMDGLEALFAVNAAKHGDSQNLHNGTFAQQKTGDEHSVELPPIATPDATIGPMPSVESDSPLRTAPVDNEKGGPGKPPSSESKDFRLEPPPSKE